MKAPDTRTLLLETALDLIWNSNYSAVGVNEICRQAGITKGSFYHHFESKAALFCAASNHHWEHIRQAMDSMLSPMNTPLEQLENWLQFIYTNKLGEGADNRPGCAFFSAGMQVGCSEPRIMETMQLMTERGAKYNQAIVRSLASGNYLTEPNDIELTARLMQQYVQGLLTYARVTPNNAQVRIDLPTAIYRLIGLKREYWFNTKPTWPGRAG